MRQIYIFYLVFTLKQRKKYTPKHLYYSMNDNLNHILLNITTFASVSYR